jgi:MFS family permease
MKPIFGMMSDLFPIWGFKKLPYMLVSSVFGVASMLAIGILPDGSLSVNMLVVCLIMSQIMFSICDLLSEAAYAEKIQDSPKYGPSLVSYVWGGLTLSSLLAVAVSGQVIADSPKLTFTISAIIGSVVFLPVLSNYLGETKMSPEEVQLERDRILKQREACILAGVMLVANVVMTFFGMTFDSVALNAAVAIFFTIVLLVSFTMLLTPVVAKFNAFQLIQGSLSLSISSASFYFYTDSEAQYPQGPHFSTVFYTSVLGIVGTCMSLLGVWCYQRWMSKWNYRNLLIFTNVFLFVLSMMDVVMFSRLNLQMGIPDHYMVLGATVSESLVAQWQWMPSVVILSYLCPKGLEATMYALLAGSANFGGIVAGDIGALLLQMLECEPNGSTGEAAAFKNLWIAALIASVAPLVVIVFLFWLIPDARQDEKLLSDGVDASTGSLWQQWFGQSPVPAAQSALGKAAPAVDGCRQEDIREVCGI